MTLKTYHQKRDFDDTPEPKGKLAKGKKGNLRFVVQKHDASHLHYDFRLEWKGVLVSFAIPKGPSMNPEDKRLAVQTEDHPLEYASFEGNIPKNNYGAGDVIVWDRGTYQGEGAKNRKESDLLLEEGFKAGKLSIEMFGEKLKGEFTLVKTRRGGEKSQWLLMKKNDSYATTREITEKNQSVLTGEKLPRDLPKKNISKTIKKVPMPKDLKPMLATLTDTPFSKEGWIFEYKYDGYRVLAEIKKESVHLFSRQRNPFDEKFKPIQEALKKIKHEVILDGEVVASQNGEMSFGALQNISQGDAELKYFVFDLIFLDGVDLRQFPLIERKKLLQKLLPNSEYLHYSEHQETEGEKYYQEVEVNGGEGLIAKRMDSKYESGTRSEAWLKIKTEKRQEAVIGGFTAPQGSRKFFGALILGVYNDQGELDYVGHAGGGLDQKILEKTYKILQKHIRKTSPFKKKPKTNAPATWLSPELVAEIKFREWTNLNIMRQPIFLGLREDKLPHDIKKEIPKKLEKVIKKSEKKEMKFTHLEKILWPKTGNTKGDLIEYYRNISEVLLPYLKERPENLLRHPHGVAEPGFYQKNVDTLNLPAFAETEDIFSESNNADIRYLICNNQETLLYMTQLGVIEVHPWHSRRASIDRPDYMIFDVDPSNKNNFQEAVQVALSIKEVLDQSCEKSFVKTSGKRGIHILVPLGAQYNYDMIREFSHMIMQLVHQKLPDLTSLERHPGDRKGKVYLDYLQNRFGQTIVAPYSLRATPEATVSTPLEWKEVTEKLDPKAFTIKTIQKRLKVKGDLWKNILNEKVDLKKSIQCLRQNLENKKS